MGLYAGNDDMLFPMLQYGAWGGICVASHLAGPQMKEMVELYRAGKHDEARRVDESLRPLYQGLFITANPIMVKAALNMQGHDVGGLRLPLVRADAGEQTRVRRVLEQLSLVAQEA